MDAATRSSSRSLALPILLLCALMIWLAANGDNWRTLFSFREPPRPTAYYGLLTRGLEAGHLWMDAPVDPRLVADPEHAIANGAPYYLDASLFNGHYYLYFGIGPVAAVYLPYGVLTGEMLSENVVAAILILAAFGWNATTYAAARQRYFPHSSRSLDFAFLSLLALGAATPFLLLSAGFYELAIAGGFTAISAGWWGLYQAWHSPNRAPWALGLASAAFAAAVGCRPVYIFALPAVLFVAFVRIRRDGRARAARLLATAVAPAASVGILLAAYNYGRFGSPLDFGFKYQVNDLMTLKLPFTKLSFFWPNLKWYFLEHPVLSPFFPYVFPVPADARPAQYYGFELIHGQWIAGVLIAGILLLAILGRRRLGAVAELLRWTALVGAVFAVLLVTLCLFGFRADRYVADFEGTAVIAVAVAGGALAARIPGRWGLVRGVLLVGALAVAAFNVLAGIHLAMRLGWPSPPGLKTLTYVGNLPSAAMARLGLLDFGPVKMRVKFPPGGIPGWSPLLTTGWPEFSDGVAVHQEPDGRTSFQVSHERYGSTRSPEMKLDPTVEHDIDIDLGSLYPPINHPYYRDLDAQGGAALARSSFQIKVDGTPAFTARFGFYERTSDVVWIGRDPDGTQSFSGRILATERLRRPAPVPPPHRTESGLSLIEAALQPQPPSVYFPVLSSGVPGNGNLLRLRTLSDHELELSLDVWGRGIVPGPVIGYQPGRKFTFELVAGPQLAKLRPPEVSIEQAAQLVNFADSFQVWVDGSLVWDVKPGFNLDSYDNVFVGANVQGFSSSQEFFPGEIRRLDLPAGALARTIDRFTGSVREPEKRAEPEWAGYPGPVRLRLRWPGATSGTRQPLVVSGATNAADFVYARWEDPAHVRIGLDHWGAAAFESPPIAIDPAHDSTVEISSAGLMPPAGAALYRTMPELAALREYTIVRIDGRTVVARKTASYDTRAAAITFAANRVGGTSAGPAFTGGVYEISPVAPEIGLGWLRNALFGPPIGANPALQGYPGSLSLRVRLPDSPAAGGREILLCTGAKGIGDVFFIQYDPGNRFRLGWDHWGSALTWSESLPLPQNADLTLEFSVDSLYPPSGPSAGRPTVVKVDGAEAIRSARPTFPSTADRISVGAGFIGGSFAVAPFSGRIVEVVGPDGGP